MQFFDVFKSALSSSKLKDQEKLEHMHEEQQPAVGEMLNFFMNIKKQSDTYAQPEYLFSQIERQRMPDRSVDKPMVIPPYTCDKSSVADVDPLYYHDNMSHKILNFELQLSQSRREIENRVNNLREDLMEVEALSNLILKKGYFRLDEWLKSIWLLDSYVQEAIERVNTKRKATTLKNTVEKCRTMAINIVSLANKRKLLEQQRSFLLNFRKNTVRLLTLPQRPSISYYLELLHSANKSLIKMRQSNTHQRIDCLRQLEARCHQSINKVQSWLTDQFINWVYHQNNSKLDFILCWMYMEMIMKDHKIVERTIGQLEQHLLSQVASKIQKIRELEKVGRNLLVPLTNIVQRVEELEGYMRNCDLSKEDLPKIAIRLAKRGFQEALLILVEKYRKNMISLVSKLCQRLLKLEIVDGYSQNFKSHRDAFLNKVENLVRSQGCPADTTSIVAKVRQRLTEYEQL